MVLSAIKPTFIHINGVDKVTETLLHIKQKVQFHSTTPTCGKSPSFTFLHATQTCCVWVTLRDFPHQRVHESWNLDLVISVFSGNDSLKHRKYTLHEVSLSFSVRSYNVWAKVWFFTFTFPTNYLCFMNLLYPFFILLSHHSSHMHYIQLSGFLHLLAKLVFLLFQNRTTCSFRQFMVMLLWRSFPGVCAIKTVPQTVKVQYRKKNCMNHHNPTEPLCLYGCL